jgi:hypothetical protein
MRPQRMIIIIVCIIAMFAFINTLHGQTGDSAARSLNDTFSTNAVPDTAYAEDDDFDLFLLLFGITVVSFTLGVAATGALVATLILLCIAALAAAGVVSTSIIVGMYRRSFAAGFSTFLFIICSIGGMIAGAGSFWLAATLFKLNVSHSTALTAGIVSGFLAGILLAFALVKIARGITSYYKKKWALG